MAEGGGTSSFVRNVSVCVGMNREWAFGVVKLLLVDCAGMCRRQTGAKMSWITTVREVAKAIRVRVTKSLAIFRGIK